MHKLLVFDLDGTLAPVGKGMSEKTIATLKELEDIGYQIAVCSGKTTFYLCGFLRQSGLKNPILIGENGANIQFGTELPPNQFYSYPYSEQVKKQIQKIKGIIENALEGPLWFQPNIAGYTPFPKDQESFEIIERLLKKNQSLLEGVTVYRHVDSFDITPTEINKYNGLKYLTKLTRILPEEMIAFGDGVNDLPMFEYVDISVGIGEKMKCRTDVYFDEIEEALEYVKRKQI